MSTFIRIVINTSFVAAALLTAVSSLADDDAFYESLPEVTIGKVFFSPQERARLDQRRGSKPAVVRSSGAKSGGNRKPGNDDAAGFITSSSGTSKVYSDGDFVNARQRVDVQFPGSVKIVRGEDPGDVEANDEAD